MREWTNCEKSRFIFTGKERDVETGYDNFGARLYDGDLGRFLSVGALSAKYSALSPYTYVADNPIIAIDPDGKEIIITAGSEKIKQEFLRQMRTFFGNNVYVDINDDGRFILKKQGDLTSDQQVAYDILHEYIASPVQMFVNASRSTSHYEAYDKNEFEPYDFNAYGDPREGRTYRRNMMGHYLHFFAEQYYKIYNNIGSFVTEKDKEDSRLPLGLKGAHKYALYIESLLTGVYTLDIGNEPFPYFDSNTSGRLFANFDMLGRVLSYYYEYYPVGEDSPYIIGIGGNPLRTILTPEKGAQELLNSLLYTNQDKFLTGTPASKE